MKKKPLTPLIKSYLGIKEPKRKRTVMLHYSSTKNFVLKYYNHPIKFIRDNLLSLFLFFTVFLSVYVWITN